MGCNSSAEQLGLNCCLILPNLNLDIEGKSRSSPGVLESGAGAEPSSLGLSVLLG